MRKAGARTRGDVGGRGTDRAADHPIGPLYTKLKPGPGISSRQVKEHQQARLRGAMVELAATRGYEKVTVRGLSNLAAVSTGTFYEHFPNVEECFASTFDSLIQRVLRRAYTARQEAAGGRESVQAALRSLLEDLANHPKEAQVVLVEAYAAGWRMQPRMVRSVNSLAAMLGDSETDPPSSLGGKRLPRAVAAGITRVARARVMAGRTAALPELAAELGDWIVSISDVERARPELTEARPKARPDPPASGAAEDEPPKAPGDRRTRILSAVAKLSLTHGLRGLTVSRICAQAGISRRAFNAHFHDVEESFVEAIEGIATSTAAQIDDPSAADGRIDLAVQDLCTTAEQQPALARLVFIEITAPGRQGLLLRERLLSRAAARLQPARIEPPAANDLHAEASIAAAWQIVQGEIEAGSGRDLPRLSRLISSVCHRRPR